MIQLIAKFAFYMFLMFIDAINFSDSAKATLIIGCIVLSGSTLPFCFPQIIWCTRCQWLTFFSLEAPLTSASTAASQSGHLPSPASYPLNTAQLSTQEPWALRLGLNHVLSKAASSRPHLQFIRTALYQKPAHLLLFPLYRPA